MISRLLLNTCVNIWLLHKGGVLCPSRKIKISHEWISFRFRLSQFFFRVPSFQRVTSGLSVPLPSSPGDPRFQPHNKNLFSAASRDCRAPVGPDRRLCGRQESPQSLNSQPERPQFHHPALAAATALWQVFTLLLHLSLSPKKPKKTCLSQLKAQNLLSDQRGR